MIKREDLRHAIASIAQTNPEIGYALDDLLSANRIAVRDFTSDEEAPSHLFFLFDNEKVPVNKVAFFMDGTQPIEQELLVKYGELREKEKITDAGSIKDYRRAAEQVRLAGLTTAVRHEIDRAIISAKNRLGKLPPEKHAARGHFESVIATLHAMRDQDGLG
ncbi:MAG TPA: hypothetical protein VKN73_14610, partial [Desulfosalsimonadaceae bacterium]|nr:hypothetical protein [Desulfosalsimonadaceae bacterium]